MNDYEADPYSAALHDILAALDKAYEHVTDLGVAEYDTLTRVADLIVLADPLARETSFTYDGDYPTEVTGSGNPRVRRAVAVALGKWLDTIEPDVTPLDYHKEA